MSNKEAGGESDLSLNERDLFDIIHKSDTIDRFYQLTRLQAEKAGERYIPTGILRLLSWKSEERYAAYNHHKEATNDSNENLLKTIDTIALLLAEKELGIKSKKRIVDLTASKRIPRVLSYKRLTQAKDCMLRASDILGLGEETMVRTLSTNELLAKGQHYTPYAPGIQVKFDLITPTRTTLNTVPYATITISHIQSLVKHS